MTTFAQSASYTLTTSLTIGHDHVLAMTELAHACGAPDEWVLALVEVGILTLPDPSAPAQTWRFDSAALRCALEARRLQRDFGVALDAAALILDLQHEIRRLKTAISLHELAVRQV